MWSQVPTNKAGGGLFPNDGDGNAWGDKQVGFPPVLEICPWSWFLPLAHRFLFDAIMLTSLTVGQKIAPQFPS
jgi:branched-chain amino acid transport system substrate-binding protein